MRITVTLARQLGSGGSYLGQRIAENLGVRCLDREILSRTAQRLDCDEAEVADREERNSSFWERMLQGTPLSPPEALYFPASNGPVSDQDLFAAETAVMKAIAESEDCVIVGRAAGHVLPAHPGLVTIFLYAPFAFRVPRAIQYYSAADAAQAKAMIARSDGARKRFIAQMTGRVWDDATNYDLCVDTSVLPLDETADFLTDYVRRKTVNQQR